MKHDESKDLKSLSKIARIDIPNKHINIPTGTHVGIKRLGMIDYLTHYCGWIAMKTNGPLVKQAAVEFKSNNARKDSKQHALSDKTKKKK